MPYAEHTTVSPEKSRMEIEQVLARYGATSFAYMTDTSRSAVGFAVKGRTIRIEISKPDASNLRVKRRGYSASPTEQQKLQWLDGENRRRWRALLLVIKAKLEAVESKIATFEDEFLAYVVMPDGRTMSEWVAPQIDRAIAEGKMPQMLLGAGVSQ